jgi:hypothetical protein
MCEAALHLRSVPSKIMASLLVSVDTFWDSELMSAYWQIARAYARISGAASKPGLKYSGWSPLSTRR